MASLMDYLLNIDGGQPNTGLMGAPAPQVAPRVQSPLIFPQDMSQMITQMQPQQVPQSPMTLPPVSGNSISDSIQQWLGAKDVPQPNTATNILSNRFAPQEAPAPSYNDYLGSMQSILTDKFQTGDQVASASYANAMDMSHKQQLLDIEREKLAQGKFTPVKDVFGNVTGIIDTKTGEVKPINNPFAQGGQGVGFGAGMGAGGMGTGFGAGNAGGNSPNDPQDAAGQILTEAGTPVTQVSSRQDLIARNAQSKGYRDVANGAKMAKQQLDQLSAQTGKYRPGGAGAAEYAVTNYLGMGSSGATARTEAEKASKVLANALMAQNVGARGAGIRMVEFDAGAIPNADMTDEARTNLIAVNKAIADSQIQRAVISDMYPRMQVSNVNTIMDTYENNNPPILPNGTVNSNWMPYQQWLAAGRPNTGQLALQGGKIGGGTVQQNSPQSAPLTNSSQPIFQPQPSANGLRQTMGGPNSGGIIQPSATGGWKIERVQ